MTNTARARAGRTELVPGAVPDVAEVEAQGMPVTALAARLCVQAEGDVIVLAANERRAEELVRALRVFAPDADVLLLRPWDCFPYDRVSPSLGAMGSRVATIRSLSEAAKRPRLVVTSPEAVMQKMVPAYDDVFPLVCGAPLDRGALEDFARRTGYVVEERVDDPGDIAFQGQVVDVFPADGDQPVRVMSNKEGAIAEIRLIDPVTQRSEAVVERLDLAPACELVLPADEARRPGIEHWLSSYHTDLRSLFDLLPGAALAIDADGLAACERFAERVTEAYEARRSLHAADERLSSAPDNLYLTPPAVKAASKKHRRLKVDLEACEATPAFTLRKDATRALTDFVRSKAETGHRIVLAGSATELPLLRRAVQRVDRHPRQLANWGEAAQVAPGKVAMLEADLELGFVDEGHGIAVVTATDVFGARVALEDRSVLDDTPPARPGDVVVHEEHGVAILRGLESVAIDGGASEMLRLDFYGDDTLLVPTSDLGRIWRYGSEPDAVTLDRLNTDGWNKRRVKVSAYVEAAATDLVAIARERAKTSTPPLKPPTADYARFTARFPFPETSDQLAAVGAVLEDLASGRPMNRLVCGDVGYGKTEIALRAAAAVALSGKQVALIAPTTVLARQHAQTFERRFAGTAVEIVHLSRLVSTSEAKDAKVRLANGQAGVVIGTQAVTGADFDDLALVIVDEEHRFGTKMKETLRTLAPHHLALSATPIPRTLQGALVGVQDVSVLGQPPARRRPVRTFLSPYDDAVARTALLREKRRDGQSFFVVPRIEDIKPVLALLDAHAPDLIVEVAHGDLPPHAVDEAMVRFADGACDVLVATALIESGLDVPRANTILIWGADRFGLAQLHQLRGRVGRGRVQGTCYLFAPAEEEVAKATAGRLATLLAADKLGAGFALSARDLDLRGGGDLVGEEQAGHMRLVGASLYQHLLKRAVRARDGEVGTDRRTPILQIKVDAFLPVDYVSDEPLRLDLYARLARHEQVADVIDFADELEDRFGSLPEPAGRLLDLQRLSILAEAAGITAVVAGPKATAITFAPGRAGRAREAIADLGCAAHWKGERLILDLVEDDGLIASLEKLLAVFCEAEAI